VPKQDAGSASGVFNTGLQLGNSIGIAVIGVIFFGMLGTQSGAAATSVAPALRTSLVAAGTPAQHTAPIETQFRACLHDRLVAADPTVAPASCKPKAGQAISPAAHRAIAAAGASAVRNDFVASVVRTLWFQVGVFFLSFLLMFVLPAGAGKHATAPVPERDAAEPAVAGAAG